MPAAASSLHRAPLDPALARRPRPRPWIRLLRPPSPESAPSPPPSPSPAATVAPCILCFVSTAPLPRVDSHSARAWATAVSVQRPPPLRQAQCAQGLLCRWAKARWLRFHSGVVRIRSTTSVSLLHGLALLPSGISGKMTTPRNHFYLCFASCSLYCHAALPITCYIMSPILPCQPLTILS
ncbi:hypothetical protein VPH35_076997 [Triticum aestivum]